MIAAGYFRERRDAEGIHRRACVFAEQDRPDCLSRLYRPLPCHGLAPDEVFELAERFLFDLPDPFSGYV